MKPTAAETENGMPRKAKVNTPPARASGTALNTTSASCATATLGHDSTPNPKRLRFCVVS